MRNVGCLRFLMIFVLFSIFTIRHLHATDAVAYFNQGNAYFEKGEYDRAISDYNKALEINPKYLPTWHCLGWVYYVKKDYAKSAKTSQKGLDVDTNSVPTRCNKAIALLHNGNYEEAIKEYKAAINLITDGKYTDGGNDKKRVFQDCLHDLYEARDVAKGKLLKEINKVITLLEEVKNKL